MPYYKLTTNFHLRLSLMFSVVFILFLTITPVLLSANCLVCKPGSSPGSSAVHESYTNTASDAGTTSHTGKPRQIVLTWEDDTQTTMTISWRTVEPQARTVGMKRIEKATKNSDSEVDFAETRKLLADKGWREAGYESPEDAFIDLCAGVMNHSGRSSDFAYRFLVENWHTYSDEIGLEKELMPDRDEWNRVYDGVADNHVLYSSEMSTFEQTEPFRTGKADKYADHIRSAEAETYTFPETSAWLHKVTLRELEPGRNYRVLIRRKDDSGETPGHTLAEPFHFRTAPDQKDSVTFIMGADTQSETQERKEMTELAASLDPEFVAMTGDLVMRGMAEDEWDAWFDEWHELMITGEGRRVPVLPALGNHDVRGWIAGDFETDAAFYANRFHLPDPERYYVIEYGEGLVLFTLDTGHTSAFNEELDWFVDTGYYEAGHGPHRVRDSHDGKQKQWLQQKLAEYKDRPWVLGQYHINAFATSPHYWEKPRYGRRLMHEHWIPLFEQYGVDLIHEAHGHRLKRTNPVKNGEINEDGVVYIGEGGWGTHMGEPDDMWFVADKGSEQHFWKLTLDEGWNKLSGHPVKWIDREAVRGASFTLERKNRTDN